jgi:hypothetical protein
MKCDRCNKSFEILNVFSPYGHGNPFIREESVKNTGYCDKCFEIKKKELESMVYKDKDNIKEIDREAC